MSVAAAGNVSVSVDVDVAAWLRQGKGGGGGEVRVKRMTAPGLDSKDSSAATWAGQSFEDGTASGEEVVEGLEDGRTVTVRGSEAVLVFF